MAKGPETVIDPTARAADNAASYVLAASALVFVHSMYVATRILPSLESDVNDQIRRNCPPLPLTVPTEQIERDTVHLIGLDSPVDSFPEPLRLVGRERVCANYAEHVRETSGFSWWNGFFKAEVVGFSFAGGLSTLLKLTFRYDKNMYRKPGSAPTRRNAPKDSTPAKGLPEDPGATESA